MLSRPIFGMRICATASPTGGGGGAGSVVVVVVGPGPVVVVVDGGPLRSSNAVNSSWSRFCSRSV